ncbi:uncharacterized protein LOC127870037 [Dreissena polymorpha]|uniref:uncharacterized protein LOC127870037 n=1 Tax=Dreissena polymorpha TaxID=45954 RepID=UPI002264FC71|nr:uncharacterized protein LOC127870037 [Dreissena polymorpha]
MPTSQHRNTKDLSAGWHFLYKYYKGAIRHVPSPSFEHYINLPTSQHPNTEDLSAGWHFLYKYYNGTIRFLSTGLLAFDTCAIGLFTGAKFISNVYVHHIIELHGVRGYQSFRCDREGSKKGGILTLVRNNINAVQTKTHMDDSEFQVLSLRKNDFNLKRVNLYSPNDEALSLDSIPTEESNFIVVGDFNSHSQSWGYDDMDRRGEEVEEWQDDNKLNLINQPEDLATFYSRKWHTTSTPDLAFCTGDIHGHIKSEVCDQLGGSDHRPVLLIMNQSTSSSSSIPRWNYKKARAKAKFLRHKLEGQRKSWRNKTASLNLERDGRKLWMLTKQLNDDEVQARGSVTMEENGELLTGKQAANVFASNYKDVSDIHASTERQRKVRKEQRDRKTDDVTSDRMNQSLTLHELQTAVRQLKLEKSPEPDNVTNEMITHLGSSAMHKLQDIFNYSWTQGQLPQVLKEAIILPILKKGKDPKQAGSYRPISLTSCVGKTMERIVNARLKLYLETNNLLAKQQAGFRQFRSTEDQTTYMAQEIEDAFQIQKVVLTAWIDLQRAFGKVLIDGLQCKLMRN